MNIVIWAFALLVFMSFFVIVFRGAPYVPTHRRDIERIFSLYKFHPGDILVDLGSGDGRVLEIAARHGISSVGYELNPFLVLYSRWRLRRYGDRSRVVANDFWRAQLPEKTAVVFVFLAGPFMTKLERKLRREADRLGHDIILISYGMKLPGLEAEQQDGGFVVYRIEA